MQKLGFGRTDVVVKIPPSDLADPRSDAASLLLGDELAVGQVGSLLEEYSGREDARRQVRTGA